MAKRFLGNLKSIAGITLVLIVIIIGTSGSDIAEAVGAAQGGGGTRRLIVPISPYDAGGVLRTELNNPTVFRTAESIELGQSAPTGAPGESVAPIPKFAGLNTRFIVNDSGPVQIADEAVIHGLIDARLGITSSGAVARERGDRQIGDAPISPLNIYDNATVHGDLSVQNRLIAGRLQTESQVNGDLRLIGGTLMVGGAITITGASALNGNVTIGSQAFPATLNVSGQTTLKNVTTQNITAQAVNAQSVIAGSIGRFSMAAGQNVSTNQKTWTQSVVSCPVNDELISCTPDFGNVDPSPDIAWFVTTGVNADTSKKCTAKIAKTVPGGAMVNIRAKALCFSPN